MEVKIVWDVPAELETMFVIPNPTWKSKSSFSNVSLVILFCDSFTLTLPIIFGDANDLADSGLDFGSSRFNWG